MAMSPKLVKYTYDIDDRCILAVFDNGGDRLSSISRAYNVRETGDPSAIPNQNRTMLQSYCAA
jgi:hypothetical protein